jgi:UDPglucose 6-dehydrogenase
VVGAGYVGLTSAACLAHFGHDIICADVDLDKIAALRKGEVPILEEGLPALVDEGLTSGRLRFVTSAPDAARDAQFVFLCVSTPAGDDGAADLSAVEAVVREVAPVLSPGCIVVNKSTAPVGTAALIGRLLSEAGAGADVGVASNPEFLREGTAVRDFLDPDRIVIGAESSQIAVQVSELYRDVPAPVVVTDHASAELVKYASNAFLATKISFVNAIANLCEAVDADVRDVTLGMGYDPRIGSDFLRPGPGWGGSCFPKDTSALLHTAVTAGYDFSLLRGVVEVNDEQLQRILHKVRDACGGTVNGAHVALWGLTFKAGTDDLRDSPAIAIAQHIIDEGANVLAFDPVAGDAARDAGLPVVADAYSACAGADVLAILTEWDEFRWLDFQRVHDAMATPTMVDARNLLDPTAMRHLGFAYQGVGR